MKYMHYYESPIGTIVLISDGYYLTELYFKNQKNKTSVLNELYKECDLEIFELTTKWLNLYFNHIIPDFMPPIKLKSTSFQQKVYQILLKIPYGKTISYGEIAKLICKEEGYSSMSAQAIGNAVKCNPILLIIPCHRVIGVNGELKGYIGGIENKEYLLKLEQSI